MTAVVQVQPKTSSPLALDDPVALTAVLVRGLQGSGKSTLCRALAHLTCPQGQWINQDEVAAGAVKLDMDQSKQCHPKGVYDAYSMVFFLILGCQTSGLRWSDLSHVRLNKFDSKCMLKTQAVNGLPVVLGQGCWEFGRTFLVRFIATWEYLC